MQEHCAGQRAEHWIIVAVKTVTSHLKSSYIWYSFPACFFSASLNNSCSFFYIFFLFHFYVYQWDALYNLVCVMLIVIIYYVSVNVLYSFSYSSQIFLQPDSYFIITIVMYKHFLLIYLRLKESSFLYWGLVLNCFFFHYGPVKRFYILM